MNRYRRMAMTGFLVGACSVTAFAGKTAVEEQLRDKLGDGAVQTMDMIEKRNPELHTRLRRALRFVFNEEFGPLRFVARLREFLADPQAREALVRVLDARHKVHELVRQYDRSSPTGRVAVKAKLREAVSEAYDARLTMGEIRARKFEERLKSRREQKQERVDKLVGLITGD